MAADEESGTISISSGFALVLDSTAVQFCLSTSIYAFVLTFSLLWMTYETDTAKQEI
jgi:hypothetical protein